MDDMVRQAEDLVVEVGRAFRLARLRRRVGQRAYADELGISKSHLARLEIGQDMAALGRLLGLLERSGFGLSLVDHEPERGRGSGLADHLIDAAGRRFPPHVHPVPGAPAPAYWFARHGWGTSRQPPVWWWTYRGDASVPR